MEEIDVIIEGEAHRANVALENILRGKEIERGDAVRRKPVAHELIKLFCHEMKGNVAAGKRIDENQVVRLRMPVQEHPGVARDQMEFRGFAQPEIFFCDLDDAGIELDRIDRSIRDEPLQINRNRSGAEPEHQHALDVLRKIAAMLINREYGIGRSSGSPRLVCDW